MKKPRLMPARAVSQSLLMLLAVIFAASAYGLTTDKDQPIEVEADAAELDDLKNISIYTGDVIVIQGSIKMTGDEMTVYYTEDNELDSMIMQGQHATYRQLPDDSTIYDQAVAYQMEYYEQKNLIILIGDACVKQEESVITGERIEYDTLLSRVKAFNQPKEVLPNAAPPKEKSRVKLVIRKDDAGTAVATTPPALPADCKIIPAPQPAAP